MATRKHTQSLYSYNIFVLVFLLFARTGCDWVEISQNYYRKEPPRPVTVNINYEETTEAIIVYKNSTLLDKHWKKGVIDRVPSIANIKRVHVPSVKTPSMQTENNIFTRQASTYINAPAGRYDSVIAKPNMLSKYHEEEILIEPSEGHEVPYHIDRADAFLKNSGVVPGHNAHVANNNIVSRIESVNKGYITNVKKENWNQDSGSVKSTHLRGSESKGINKKIEMNSEDKTSEVNDTHFKNQNVSDKNRETIGYKSNEEATKTNLDGISNITKGSTINTMWKLIKVVTDSIYKSTRKSFKSKINYLEGLRSNILASIENQVERTWPDDNARSSRRVRDAAGRGHVEFPSSESALMSISFLTFAVFLIKLVLQVIHTYKTKTMMVTPAVVTAVGRAAAAVINSNQQ